MNNRDLDQKLGPISVQLSNQKLTQEQAQALAAEPYSQMRVNAHQSSTSALIKSHQRFSHSNSMTRMSTLQFLSGSMHPMGQRLNHKNSLPIIQIWDKQQDLDQPSQSQSNRFRSRSQIHNSMVKDQQQTNVDDENAARFNEFIGLFEQEMTAMCDGLNNFRQTFINTNSEEQSTINSSPTAAANLTHHYGTTVTTSASTNQTEQMLSPETNQSQIDDKSGNTTTAVATQLHHQTEELSRKYQETIEQLVQGVDRQNQWKEQLVYWFKTMQKEKDQYYKDLLLTKNVCILQESQLQKQSEQLESHKKELKVKIAQNKKIFDELIRSNKIIDQSYTIINSQKQNIDQHVKVIESFQRINMQEVDTFGILNKIEMVLQDESQIYQDFKDDSSHCDSVRLSQFNQYSEKQLEQFESQRKEAFQGIKDMKKILGDLKQTTEALQPPEILPMDMDISQIQRNPQSFIYVQDNDQEDHSLNSRQTKNRLGLIKKNAGDLQQFVSEDRKNENMEQIIVVNDRQNSQNKQQKRDIIDRKDKKSGFFSFLNFKQNNKSREISKEPNEENNVQAFRKSYEIKESNELNGIKINMRRDSQNLSNSLRKNSILANSLRTDSLNKTNSYMRLQNERTMIHSQEQQLNSKQKPQRTVRQNNSGFISFNRYGPITVNNQQLH